MGGSEGSHLLKLYLHFANCPTVKLYQFTFPPTTYLLEVFASDREKFVIILS